jgi:acyl-CoA dehydrogenase
LRAHARTASSYVLDGEKTWISNGGIADFYVVFARSGEAPGTRGISVPSSSMPQTPGLEIAERIEVIAPHPLARLRFSHCRIPASKRLGGAGQGFKLAMRTLDIFRTSVAAAALGFARRALDEALQRALGAQDVRPHPGRLPTDPGQTGRHGGRH